MRAFRGESKPAKPTRTRSLKCIPIKNTECKEERLETGEVVLTYSLNIRPWFAGLVRRFGGEVNRVQPKKLQLDELGTAVWDLIDGRRSVLQIIKRFSTKYQLHTKEAEVGVTRFLRIMGKRGLLGLK